MSGLSLHLAFNPLNSKATLYTAVPQVCALQNNNSLPAPAMPSNILIEYDFTTYDPLYISDPINVQLNNKFFNLNAILKNKTICTNLNTLQANAPINDITLNFFSKDNLTPVGNAFWLYFYGVIAPDHYVGNLSVDCNKFYKMNFTGQKFKLADLYNLNEIFMTFFASSNFEYNANTTFGLSNIELYCQAVEGFGPLGNNGQFDLLHVISLILLIILLVYVGYKFFNNENLLNSV